MKALSREIKFRAWNPSTKTYGYFEPFKRFELSAEPDYDGYMGKINTWRYKKGAMGDMGMYYEFSISHENVEDLVFQQYTGLLDKNGKEIYEGDIVRVITDLEEGAELLMKVEWENGAFILYGYGWAIILCEEERYRELEIISNIYENPELLTKENK